MVRSSDWVLRVDRERSRVPLDEVSTFPTGSRCSLSRPTRRQFDDAARSTTGRVAVAAVLRGEFASFGRSKQHRGSAADKSYAAI
ncbi:hypothetical protein DMJ13_01000 [halophilic archaeon]|nr:hypothetical protein DMJ13_01000 [halophilic archaeon]